MSSKALMLQHSALWFNDGRTNRHTTLRAGDVITYRPETHGVRIMRRNVALEWEQPDRSRLPEIFFGDMTEEAFRILVKVITGIFGFKTADLEFRGDEWSCRLWE